MVSKNEDMGKTLAVSINIVSRCGDIWQCFNKTRGANAALSSWQKREGKVKIKQRIRKNLRK